MAGVRQNSGEDKLLYVVVYRLEAVRGRGNLHAVGVSEIPISEDVRQMRRGPLVGAIIYSDAGSARPEEHDAARWMCRE
jgi:hypothetical protein